MKGTHVHIKIIMESRGGGGGVLPIMAYTGFHKFRYMKG